MRHSVLLAFVAIVLAAPLSVRPAPVKQDYHIDGAAPGVRLFVRQKMDYSWADWMISKGYVTYLFDKRNYGYSSREKAMDEPATSNKPVSRSYQVIRDIGRVVEHIRQTHKVNKVTLSYTL